MKKIVTLFLITALFSLSAGEIIDFSKDTPPLQMNMAQERNQQIVSAEKPDGKRALRITWDARKHIYGEFAFVSSKQLERFDYANFLIKVTSCGKCPVRIFNLRMVDAKGEVFQWNGNADWQKAGDYDLKFSVTPENFNLAFGGNNDKKMDFPVRLQGVSFDLWRGSATGEVFLNSIEYETSRKSELNEVKFDIDSGNPVHVLKKGEEKSLSLSFSNPSGVVLDCNLDLTFTDFFGKSARESGPCTLR